MVRRGAPALVIGVLLALGSLFAAAVIQRGQSNRAERDDRALARQTAAALSTSLELTGATLTGTGGLTTAAGDVRKRSFEAYARGVLRTDRCSALTYVRAITDAERAATERELGRQVSEQAGGQARPRRTSDVYWPITYLVSRVGGIDIVGFDTRSDPNRARAIFRARDTGSPRATVPRVLTLNNEPGLVVYAAVYNPVLPVDTVDQRRTAFAGAVGCTVSLAGIEAQVRENLPPDARLRVSYEDTVALGEEEPLDGSARAQVTALGRELRVEATLGEQPSPAVPAIVALGGSMVAFLIAMLIRQGARRVEALERASVLDERERGRRAVLLRAAGAMQLPLDVQSRFQLLMDSVVPGLADTAAAFRVEDGRPEMIGVRAGDPALLARLERIDLSGRSPRMSAAISSQRPQLIGRVDDEVVQEASVAEQDAQARRELGMSSLVLSPLVARGRTLGVLVVGRTENSPPYDDGDVALLQELVTHAAVAIDNARLFELEHEISRTLQRALLPISLPDTDPLKIATRYRAAGERIEVGGDVFDVFLAGGAPCVMVGDVCGKGPEAAAMTATARHALRSRAEELTPAAMLEHVDRTLRAEDDGVRFCTMAVARFAFAPDDSAAIATISVGGHPPPVILRTDGRVEAVSLTGSLLGVLDDASFGEAAVELRTGDMMLLYTDGVTEGRRDGDVFGDERLLEVVAGSGASTPDELLDAVLDAAIEFSGGEPQDDIALLAVQLQPEGRRRRAEDT